MDVKIAVALITGSFGLGTILLKFGLDYISKKKKVRKTPKFVEHQIFSRLDMLKNHIGMSFELENKGKEVVFKDLLLNSIDIWKNVSKEMADDFDGKSEITNSPAKLRNTVMRYYEKGMHDSTHYFKSDRYTPDEQRAMEIVMSKFDKWNFPRMQSTHDTIVSICNSQFYADDHVKVAVILDILLSMLVDVINDAELTLNEINGDLRGLVFKGITI